MRPRRMLMTVGGGILVVMLVAGGATARPGPARTRGSGERAASVLGKMGRTKGICVILDDAGCSLALDLAKETDMTIYVQLSRPDAVRPARDAACAAGLYGSRVYVGEGGFDRIHLADNIADAVIVKDAATTVEDRELLRVLCPGGKALVGTRTIVKPFPEGMEDWTHPDHGPDNNPVSNDQVARAPYLTQFLAKPRYAPMPQVTVAAGGRVFKLFGYYAPHPREEPMLQTLLAINAFNGSELWRRKLDANVKVLRNTVVATPKVLYLAASSCERIDPETGNTIDRIEPSIKGVKSPSWKWMAIEGETLFGLLGERDKPDALLRSRQVGGGWSWKFLRGGWMPETGGRVLIALDLASKKILWQRVEEKPIFGHAVCLRKDRLYFFQPEVGFTAIDAKTSKDIWKVPGKSDAMPKWNRGAMLKCSDSFLLYGGLLLSAKDGAVVKGKSGKMLLIGDKIVPYKAGGASCTRGTASVDSIFNRSGRGTHRLDLPTNKGFKYRCMRPSCNDGVTVTNGLLYWWPFVCNCGQSMYGIICLGPSGDYNFEMKAGDSMCLRSRNRNRAVSAAFDPDATDWPAYRRDNVRSGASTVEVGSETTVRWTSPPGSACVPTAPVAVGNAVFLGGDDGVVRALEGTTGKLLWKAYTSGAVRFPPTVWEGRALVGSADGWVYAFDAVDGTLLWRFRAAPVERRIPVFGMLTSTWPVDTGVAVHDGVAYVAAGMNGFDGTHVYALDASTGRLKWHNNDSGNFSNRGACIGKPLAQGGIVRNASASGGILVDDGKVYLAGSHYCPAVFEAAGGKYLGFHEELTKYDKGSELCMVGGTMIAYGPPFYVDTGLPSFPLEYADLWLSFSNKVVAAAGRATTPRPLPKDARLMLTYTLQCADLKGAASKEEAQFNKLAGQKKAASVRLKKLRLKTRWTKEIENCRGVALAANAVVALVGKNASEKTPGFSVAAFKIKDGSKLWEHDLPSMPRRAGLAIDRNGQVIVSLDDGSVLCVWARQF